MTVAKKVDCSVEGMVASSVDRTVRLWVDCWVVLMVAWLVDLCSGELYHCACVLIRYVMIGGDREYIDRL